MIDAGHARAITDQTVVLRDSRYRRDPAVWTKIDYTSEWLLLLVAWMTAFAVRPRWAVLILSIVVILVGVYFTSTGILRWHWAQVWASPRSPGVAQGKTLMWFGIGTLLSRVVSIIRRPEK